MRGRGPILILAARVAATIAVVAIAGSLRLMAVSRLPIDYDEDDYLLAGQQYAAAIRAGDVAALTGLNYRTEHPPLAKIAFGAALAPLPPAPLVPDQPTSADPAKSLPQPQFTVARTLSATFGTLEVLVLATVSPLAGLLLAAHTWTIKYTSQVMLEALPALLSLVSVVAYARSGGARGRRRGAWLAVSAVALGLTAASKYLYAVAGVAIVLDWALRTLEPATGHFGGVRGWFRRVKPGRLVPIAGWGLLAIIAFVAADPYLWPDPVGRMAESIRYFAGYTKSVEVSQAGFPLWQPFVWLAGSVPYYPRLSIFVVSLDIGVTLFALRGLRGLWRTGRVYVLWFAVALLFLLAWPTKWPQYILVVTAPLGLAAAEGIREVVLPRVIGLRTRALGAVWRWTVGPRRAPRPERAAGLERTAGLGDPRHGRWAQVRRATPWVVPGLTALSLLVIFPLAYQFAMSLTDASSLSLRDALHGGVFRAVADGLTGAARAVPYDPFSDPTSGRVNWVGPSSVVSVLDGTAAGGFSAQILVFDALWTILAVGVQAGLGIAVALVLNRRGIRFAGWWRAVFILPWAIPEFVGALMWLHIVEPDYGSIALLTHGTFDWASSSELSLVILLVAGLWIGWPVMMLAATAALRAIPADVDEAAMLDGASSWARFRAVTLPMLVPILVPILLIRAIAAFNQFYLFWTLSPPFGMLTMATLSYVFFDPALGGIGGHFAAGAAINIATLAILAVLAIRFLRITRPTEALLDA